MFLLGYEACYFFLAQNKTYICYRVLTLITEGGENLVTKNPKRTYVKGKYGTACVQTVLSPKQKKREKELNKFHETHELQGEYPNTVWVPIKDE